MSKHFVVSAALFLVLFLGALAAQAHADIFVHYGDDGVPEICVQVLKEDSVTPETLEPGYSIEKPSSCPVTFTFDGVNDNGEWLVTVAKGGEAHWRSLAGKSVVLRKLPKNPVFPAAIEDTDISEEDGESLEEEEVELLPEFKSGDILIRPFGQMVDLEYTDEMTRDLRRMVVADSYSRVEGVVSYAETGTTVLINDKFKIMGGTLPVDEAYPLKPISNLDKWVVVAYMALMVLAGILVAKWNKGGGDFFKGGNHMPWWLAGVSLFMSCFSTYTFVGGAGLAFHKILMALIMYFSNIGGFVLGYIVLAARWRRTRAITTMQYLEERYDNATHQLFSWWDVVIGFFYGGVQLLSLAAIVGGAMDLVGPQMYAAIVIIGIAIIVYTVIGGFWAVCVTDMLQFVILLPIVMVMGFLSLKVVGGLGTIIDNAPAGFWDLTTKDFPPLFLVANAIMMIFAMSSGGAAQRYFAVRNESGAKKVALVSIILSIAGPIIWFVPPMVAAYLHQTGQMTMLQLIPDKPLRECSYILMCRRLLPPGLIGIVLAAMFAATMSSIDTAFNFRGAILSRDIIKKYFMPNLTDRGLLIVGRLVTCFIGIVVIGLAAIMHARGQSIFKIMWDIGAFILLPAGIPIVFGLLVHNTKRWAGFATMSVGVALGLVNVVCGFLGIPLVMSSGAQVTIIGGICLLVYAYPTIIWPENDEEYQTRLNAFWTKLHTPVDEEKEVGQAMAGLHSFTLTGLLTLIIGIGISTLYIFNPDGLIIVTGLITILLGIAIWATGLFASARDQ